VDLVGGLGRWVPTIAVSLLALPVGALAAWWLAEVRSRGGMARADAWRTALTETGIVVGTVPWVVLILTPLPAHGLVFLVPFSDLSSQLEHPPLWVFYQVTGNLLVFAAFGFLAPIRWRIRPLWVIAIAAAGSITVETLQWALMLGRVASVDDVLLNAAGAGLAAQCSRRLWKAR